jgi:hypothetical protein
VVEEEEEGKEDEGEEAAAVEEEDLLNMRAANAGWGSPRKKGGGVERPLRP